MVDKVRENRLRRMAERRGLQLVKSRRRDPRSLEFGTYGLLDPFRNAWIFCDQERGYGKTLDEIEEYLDG
jgi:hypothetical protein